MSEPARRRRSRSRRKPIVDRRKAERAGRRAEWIAMLFYTLTGWRICGRRVRTPQGEVDVVARRGRTVAFVEVKWRKERKELDTAITEGRLRRVASCTRAIGPRFAGPADIVRIDVFMVAPWTWPRIVRNAWQPDRH